MRSVVLLAKNIPLFVVWCRVTGGLLRPSGGVRFSRSRIEEISRGLASGSSIREIAKCLERAVSTVSREVARHGGRPAYRASQADGEAWQSALRPKRCLLSINLKLCDIVASKLMLDWSPKQISGWLKNQHPDDESNARVPRNHLPKPVHSSPWSTKKRAAGAPAIQASHTPVAALSHL